jgi:hypothetical protein
MLRAAAARTLSAALTHRRPTTPAPSRTWLGLWLVLPIAAAGMLLASHAAALRLLGTFLVVEEPLEPAAAIIVLAGQMPQRETEAAAIYRAGWAPRVVLVPGADKSTPRGSAPPAIPDWQVRSDLLVRLGVPLEAITIADGRAKDTLEELQLAQRTIEPGAERVILVSSKFHARRVLSGWQQSAPKAWQPIVRIARRDPFDPDTWWHDPQGRAVVVHEYLGLVELVVRRVWPAPVDLANT